MSVRVLAISSANTFASTALHFGKQDSNFMDDAFLNISCLVKINE
ncbi:hypothetical protein [Bartonella sp. WD16.2]|nr:hypothetical protein [Bartonella sp. WD16.2]AQX19205.1 hypothetical protein BWD162_000650 [Bartonella sp. WD16.2]